MHNNSNYKKIFTVPAIYRQRLSEYTKKHYWLKFGNSFFCVCNWKTARQIVIQCRSLSIINKTLTDSMENNILLIRMVCSLSIFQSLTFFAENILRRCTGLFALKTARFQNGGALMISWHRRVTSTPFTRSLRENNKSQDTIRTSDRAISHKQKQFKNGLYLRVSMNCSSQ